MRVKRVKIEFSWADLIMIVSSLVFGFICFCSLNFITLGNTSEVFITAAKYTLILVVLAYVGRTLKTATSNFKTHLFFELVVLVCFLIAAFSFGRTFSHFFVVTAQKNEIQESIKNNLEKAEDIFVDYEKYAETRLNVYRSRLQTVVEYKRSNSKRYRDFGFNNDTNDSVQVSAKMSALRYNLFPQDYRNREQDFIAQLAKAKQATEDDWVAWTFEVVDVVNNLENRIKQRFLDDYLIENSAYREDGEEVYKEYSWNETHDFSYDLSFEDVREKFQTQEKPPLLVYLFAVALYGLMLFSWFFGAWRIRSLKRILKKREPIISEGFNW